MKNLYYILCLLFLTNYAYSQSADEEIFIPADTSKKYFHSAGVNNPVSFSYEEETEEDNDEITELYGDFKNNVVHQYKYKEVFQTRDSLIINFDEQNFSLPFDGKINSHYGWRRYRPHYGTDIDLNTGDSVRCVFNGVVRYANKRVKGYGQVIVVRHFNGLETVYGHLSKIMVNSNDTVKAGDVIGLGGSTGRSTGPHLHFEIRCLGVPINSEDIIDYDNKCLKRNCFILTKKDAEETYNLRSKKYHYQAKSRGIYIVKKGDTLSKIARKTGVPMSLLLKKNKLKKDSVIRPGKKLYL
ncbi:MAG: LysM peptidoglycan-binding domain-containing protein [Bacteroidetes bacterium]|nr:MAG: LysM peptidoglycan-binding domain-containing protein [Bacteroidota bacterium]